jgi:nodulation protein F
VAVSLVIVGVPAGKRAGLEEVSCSVTAAEHAGPSGTAGQSAQELERPDDESCGMMEVAEGVMEIIAATSKRGGTTLQGSDWLDELGIGSLEAVEMIFELEDRFGIEIPVNANNTGEVFKTVADVVRLVEELVAAKDAT